MKDSRFSKDALVHVCQRANDWGLIFYTFKDRLVYFTNLAVHCKRYRIHVCAASIMFNHTHLLAAADSLNAISNCIRDTTSAFSRAYNARKNRKGPLFHRDFKRSFKRSLKAKRSCTAYVFNNHVEKKLFRKALESRWDFLAYALGPAPFSRSIEWKMVSKPFLHSARTVDRHVEKQSALSYEDLDIIFASLDSAETEQMIDYIISSYALIDYRMTISLFGSFDMAVLAFDSNTGADYDIKEEIYSTDVPFAQACSALPQSILDKIYIIDDDRLVNLIHFLLSRFFIPKEYMEKIFHRKL